ncbi:MAG: hypothetical protein ACT4OZ_14595 [Gemmatimonadota bacterium]
MSPGACRPRSFPGVRRGVALVLVLWIVVLLGSVGTAVVAGARTSSALAANARARVAARYASESGVVLARSRIEAALAAGDSVSTDDYLNALERLGADSGYLGDARFQFVVVDPGARLDVNMAPATSLASLLSQFTDAGRARTTAEAIRYRIERRGAGVVSSPLIEPLRSLEELRTIEGVDTAALRRAASFLTVDGDGTINVATAPAQVQRAAFGEMRTRPSRLVIISRGWLDGHPLTWELQAVFAISNMTLVPVARRERTL